MLTSKISLVWWVCLTLYVLAPRPLATSEAANLPSATNSSNGNRIAGTVVSKADARPLARARITIRDAKNPGRFQSVITAEDGKFEFSGLPAGKYSLDGAKRGFIAAGYDQHDQYSTAIVTGAGLETEALVLRLAPNAVITGKVLDEFGEPVRQATVTLYYDDHSGGVDRIRQGRGTQTDDQGTYEMTPLRPGTYFLSVNATPWYAVHPNTNRFNEPEGQRVPEGSVDRILDVAYPLTFYPDVTDADSASPIPVRGGDRLQVDIHLNPVPALRVLFRVPEDGKNGFATPQFQQPAFDGATFVQNSGTQMISPGLWEVTGIPAGRYDIRLAGAGESREMNGVDLGKDGEEIDTSKAETTSNAKVSVQIPDESRPSSRIMVGLRSGRRVSATWQMINPKGEAEFDQIAPGPYEVLVQASDKRYSIAHMVAESGQVAGHILTVAAGSSASVSLTLVGGNVDVQGTVNKSKKALAGAMVVLVPRNSETDHDLFRRDQSDLDGTFVLHGVIPGSYTLLAIENGWDLDWSQSGVIAAYLKRGRAIQVGNLRGPMNVAEPIEVQSK